MNDSAAGFLPTGIPLNFKRVFSGRKLIVETPDEIGLLAMKIAASRDTDRKDAVLLARKTGITSKEELAQLFAKAYPTMKPPRSFENFVSYVSQTASAVSTSTRNF